MEVTVFVTQVLEMANHLHTTPWYGNQSYLLVVMMMIIIMTLDQFLRLVQI